MEDRLGYRFSDRALLEQALTHRSFGSPHNERLEFLGDSVLGCVVAAELFARFPQLDEGQLSRMRANLVREETLARIAEAQALGSALKLGEGEVEAGAQARASILADSMEALFGAVYLDGGFDAARRVILAAIAEALAATDPAQSLKDAKTRLQEYLQAKRRPLPEYRVVSVQGAAHQQTFEVECRLTDGAARATGSGTSRQRAEQQAAERVIGMIGA